MSLAQSTKKVDAGKVKGPYNVPSVVEVRMTGSLPNGKPWVNTLHGFYSVVPPNIQSLASALFSSLSAAWGTRIGTYLHPSTTFSAVYVRDMQNFAFPVYIGTGTAVAGSGTGNAMPPQNAIVLTENINARGRGLKGRLYIGGWHDGDGTSVGGISGAVQSALNSLGADWISALSAQSLTACVAQAPRNPYIGYAGTSHPARAAGHVNITTITCRDTLWDTQRRRGQL